MLLETNKNESFLLWGAYIIIKPRSFLVFQCTEIVQFSHFWAYLYLSISPSGSAVQQIGLSVPVIIIKQEEACQCQCACRDSAKEKATSKKGCSSPDLKTLEQPTLQLQPQTFPSSSSSSSCELSGQIVNPSDSRTETLSAMDVSDFLSLQNPETSSNLIPIEALLQGEEEIGLNSSFSKWRCSRFFSFAPGG